MGAVPGGPRSPECSTMGCPAQPSPGFGAGGVIAEWAMSAVLPFPPAAVPKQMEMPAECCQSVPASQMGGATRAWSQPHHVHACVGTQQFPKGHGAQALRALQLPLPGLGGSRGIDTAPWRHTVLHKHPQCCSPPPLVPTGPRTSQGFTMPSPHHTHSTRKVR